MKKLFTLLVASTCVVIANAQSASGSVNSKIEEIEGRLALQEEKIAKLASQVEDVTKQNLALKQNLNLLPTVASCKAGDVEYRIVEIAGDPTAKTAHITMIADNKSDSDREIIYKKEFQIVDDKGHAIENSSSKQRFALLIEGRSKELLGWTVAHHPDAPYTIDAYIYDCDPSIQYIKYLDFNVYDSSVTRKNYTVAFKNLPIKWEAGK